jgi:hypothetical protein
MIHPDDRVKATLRAIIAFAKARDRWPDAPELRHSNPKLGSHATVHASLTTLREHGLIELRGWSAGARWTVTDDGFAVLGKPIFAPSMERRRARLDANAALATTQNHPNRKPWPKKPTRVHEIAAALIEVYG